MAEDNGTIVLVGSVWQGIMRSADGGETWRREHKGMHFDATVRTLLTDAKQSRTVYAGTDRGVYRSDSAGETWRRLGSELNDFCVWSLAIDSARPDVIFAGTGSPTRATVFRSVDAGESWEERPADIPEGSPETSIPRITAIGIDPVSSQNIWLSIEVDGLRHSGDGGNTWTRVDAPPPSPDRYGALDVHNLAVTAGPPKTIIAVYSREVYTSVDDGATWQPVGVRDVFPLHSLRGIAVDPSDPRTIFVGMGDETPGYTGGIMRSPDIGKTWESMSLSTAPNSLMWAVNAQAADPRLLLAATRHGYVYRSDDRGTSWRKLWREFGEIASIAWMPA